MRRDLDRLLNSYNRKTSRISKRLYRSSKLDSFIFMVEENESGIRNARCVLFTAAVVGLFLFLVWLWLQCKL